MAAQVAKGRRVMRGHLRTTEMGWCVRGHYDSKFNFI
jgi:hypothetical protein